MPDQLEALRELAWHCTAMHTRSAATWAVVEIEHLRGIVDRLRPAACALVQFDSCCHALKDAPDERLTPDAQALRDAWKVLLQDCEAADAAKERDAEKKLLDAATAKAYIPGVTGYGIGENGQGATQ